MQTSDLHGNLRAYDYLSDTGGQSYGLTRLATLIKQARRESPNCLLFDCGDFLQGTPLSDLTANPEYGWAGPNPVIDVMNQLKYDAVGLGNHEFNFGLNWLAAAVKSAQFPMICANVLRNHKAKSDLQGTLVEPFVILNKTLKLSEKRKQLLRIGVLGLVPPQITSWDRAHLQGRIKCLDMLEAAQDNLQKMRAMGTDLIVLLAHTGAIPGPAHDNMENAALQLADAGGIDAILAGHTHQVFPRPDQQSNDGIDHQASTFCGVPAVMAGFRGSHLGVLDLALTHDGTRWYITGHNGRAIAASALDVPEDKALTIEIKKAHHATRTLVARPLGHCGIPLHSYLARIRPDPSLALIARATKRAVANALQDSPHADLPVLSAVAPFKTGGQAGPEYYHDIPPGQIRLRHLFGLYPFPNTVCALKVTGAELLEWLERTASCFNHLETGTSDQPLLNPHFPGHAFDVIHGIQYQIDLSQLPRYKPCGTPSGVSSGRILDLKFHSQIIDINQKFIIATNSHRAHGGGLYPDWPADRWVINSANSLQDILSDELQRNIAITPKDLSDWRFVPMPETTAIFETGPGVRAYQTELSTCRLSDLGNNDQGFAKLRLQLGPRDT